MNITTVCNISHPIFSTTGNETRREILRLIACEHNYGNRIASILNKSRPAIHRHLKYLEDEGFITQSTKTNQSFSGYKGAEATLFEINSNLNVFFSLQPNFVHSHIIETDVNGNIVENMYEDYNQAEYIPSKNIGEGKNAELKTEFAKIFQKVQHMNSQIIVFEEQMAKVMAEKNQTMQSLDELIRKSEDLTYEERVVLRGLTCLGPSCIPNLADILNESQFMIEDIVSKLITKGWITPVG